MVRDDYEFKTGRGHKDTVREVAETAEDLRRIHQFARNPQSGRTRNNPIFPASRPANRSFNGLHPKSKFLAFIDSSLSVAGFWERNGDGRLPFQGSHGQRCRAVG